MKTNDFDIDPNEPTGNQKKLKRVEIAIRKRGQCELLMMLDAVGFLQDAESRRDAMFELKKKLES